jgi:hypothetical protein
MLFLTNFQTGGYLLLLSPRHYGSMSLPRVSNALGEDPKTLGEGFPECNTRGRPTGEAVHGEEAFPEC